MNFEQIECGGVPLDSYPSVQLIEAGYLEPSGRPTSVLFAGSDAGVVDLGDLSYPADDCPAFECVDPDCCQLLGRCTFGAEPDVVAPLRVEAER